VTAPAPPPPGRPGSGGVPGRGGPARPRSAEQPTGHPRVLAGRYRLDTVIGKGSMGTVWSATDEVLHRQVAIKEIDFPVGTPAAERAQLEHRTLREARAIARLSNPYVITLFDILTLDNGPVIVMELLRSRSLAEILRKVGRLPDGQAATIGVAVASGLLAAHAAGITHRDVKPGNVLICDDGRIKLTDFGIARASGDQTMTATGLLLGSPAYIAPEVANGIPAGPMSDAWSLGGLLFACVEGRPPFDQGTAIATLTSVVKDPVPPHPHSDRLGAVVSGLLVKTPTLRMRIDRALSIMRGIADDPSGTHLAVVARIPRDDATPGHGPAPGGPPMGGPAAGRTSGPSHSETQQPVPPQPISQQPISQQPRSQQLGSREPGSQRPAGGRAWSTAPPSAPLGSMAQGDRPPATSPADALPAVCAPAGRSPTTRSAVLAAPTGARPAVRCVLRNTGPRSRSRPTHRRIRPGTPTAALGTVGVRIAGATAGGGRRPARTGPTDSRGTGGADRRRRRVFRCPHHRRSGHRGRCRTGRCGTSGTA
jgi:serine/threonine protein kinase